MNTEQFRSVATRVSAVGMAGNVALTLFKLAAGILGRSRAMISDAVHSASDILSGLIVIIGVRMSTRKADEDHPYGHERFESVASGILSAVLMSVGGSIGVGALNSITSGSYVSRPVPGMLALVAAMVSIVAKEAMFWYTYVHARRIGSSALKAEAWHHRSDALSSVGALAGILGARLGVAVMEPLASLVISLFILKVALEIFRDAVDGIVDHAGPTELETAIRTRAASQPGVLGVDVLHTRMFGNRVYVDLEISADGDMRLSEAHAIAERVHDEIEAGFPQVKHIMVHVNPGKAE
ncbi:MAG: cation transporter [Clostridia bacterium]|nr:cation transporter [Clostridia bacterium]